ncbi:uncharacterized protein [Chelonus insularis]|nr:uncharacterized protein LOC118065394 isoform X3 [Chelonus insularis]
MKLKLFWINIFFSFISYIVRIEALVSDSLTKILRGNYNNIRIPLLLNQLCNESQGDDGVLRDACYGCFFRATNRPPGYPLLLAMSNCGDLYLDNTNYGSCQAYLRNASRNIDIRSSPSIIYCTFLECIRQVNKDSLEARAFSNRRSRSSKSTLISKFNPLATFWPQYVVAQRAICIINANRRTILPFTIRPDAEPISPR